ncbi:MAG: AAA family ATPase [Candidatus Bathyarchaeia archaeon]
MSREKKRKIVVCIAGLTGCGKSTVAKRLAEKYGLKYLSGGMALKELAIKMGYKPREIGWWETSEGVKFLEHRLKDPKFDKQVDEQLLKWAKRGNVVFDSWTMPWLFKGGFKIWFEASPEVRARRLAERDGISVKEATKAVKEKDEKTRRIYCDLYGFKLGEDFSPFNLILDVNQLDAEEVFETLCLVVDHLVLGRRTSNLK